MTFMLALHILAAILFLGPVTVATSMFPGAIKHASGQTGLSQAVLLNRITSVYGVLSLLVPALGFGLMLSNHEYFKQGRFHVAITLSIIAWLVLLLLILPRQKKLLAAHGHIGEDDEPAAAPAAVAVEKETKNVTIFSGVFALLWLIAALMMFI